VRQRDMNCLPKVIGRGIRPFENYDIIHRETIARRCSTRTVRGSRCWPEGLCSTHRLRVTSPVRKAFKSGSRCEKGQWHRLTRKRHSVR
jgi:hypothetical protein